MSRAAVERLTLPSRTAEDAAVLAQHQAAVVRALEPAVRDAFRIVTRRDDADLQHLVQALEAGTRSIALSLSALARELEDRARRESEEAGAR